MNSMHVEKYVPPTKYDLAPQGSTWRFCGDDHSLMYVQLNPDMSAPHWEHIGTFLEKVFEEFYENQTFIQECLRLYSHNLHNPLHNISKIIDERDALRR
jgi:hypothetical protein